MMYTVQCKLYIIKCTLHCTPYTVLSTVYADTIHWTLYTVHCILKTLQVKVPSGSVFTACSSRSRAIAQGWWQILGLFTVYSLLCALNSLQCAVMYSWKCTTMYNVTFTKKSVQCAMYSVKWTPWTVYCRVSNFPCRLYIVPSALLTV